MTPDEIANSLDDQDAFQKEEYNFSGTLRYPRSMGTTKEAKQAAADKLNTWLLERNFSFQLNSSSLHARNSYPEHISVDITGEMSEELYEDVRNEFIEQDRHTDAVATYGSVQSEPFITLEIRYGDNEWVVPPPSPPEPDDDYDPEFYKDHDRLDESKHVVEALDDTDEFESPYFCDRCNEPFGREELARANPYESGWDVNRYCAQCLEIIHQGPQNDDWLKFYESIDKKSITEGIHPILLVQVLNHRGIKPSPEYTHPPPEPESKLLPESGPELDDTDEFESMESPCDEGMPHGGWDVVLHDRQGNGVTEELFGEYNLSIFIAEHPLGFDTGGCLVWLEIQDDWTGDRPFPTVYYWRGRWRTEDEPGGRWQAENKTSVKSIAEDLDDKDEFGEPPFIQIVITDPKLSAKDAIARTIDVLKNPRGFNSYRDQNGWNVTGVEVTAYSPSDSVNTPDAWNLPSYEELANIPGALTEVEGFLQHNEPLLANPDLAFTDHFNGPGIQITTYVGY